MAARTWTVGLAIGVLLAAGAPAGAAVALSGGGRPAEARPAEARRAPCPAGSAPACRR